MKFITLTLFIFSITTAQEKFTYDQNGLKPEFLVVEKDSINQSELYKKAINWVKETYKNPDEVIKTTIENEKIRFEGVKMNLICVSTLGSKFCYNATYVIELAFRDGRYKFTPFSMTYRVPPSQYNANTIVPIDFTDGQAYYNKKGKLRGSTSTIPESIEGLLNGLNNSLSEYISKDNSSEKW